MNPNHRHRITNGMTAAAVVLLAVGAACGSDADERTVTQDRAPVRNDRTFCHSLSALAAVDVTSGLDWETLRNEPHLLELDEDELAERTQQVRDTWTLERAEVHRQLDLLETHAGTDATRAMAAELREEYARDSEDQLRFLMAVPDPARHDEADRLFEQLDFSQQVRAAANRAQDDITATCARFD